MAERMSSPIDAHRIHAIAALRQGARGMTSHEMRRGIGSDPDDSLPVIDLQVLPPRPFPTTLGNAGELN